MSFWDGDLRNSRGDIVIDNALLLLIALTNFLQIHRLVYVGSLNGISTYFLLFNALFSNFQLANTLLFTARAWPTNKNPVLELIGSGELHGARALGAVLGIVQVALHWACSTVLVVLSAAYTYNNNSTSPSSFASRTAIPAIAFVHAALFLFPAVAIALPRPSPPRMGIDIFTGFSAIVNIWLSLAFAVLQFPMQFLEYRRMSAPGSLSLLSLGLRAWATLAIAVRWFQRLRAPTWQGRYAAPLSVWYQWGWLPFNYAIEGIGCAVLVGMYLRAGRMGGALNTGEETRLLA